LVFFLSKQQLDIRRQSNPMNKIPVGATLMPIIFLLSVYMTASSFPHFNKIYYDFFLNEINERDRWLSRYKRKLEPQNSDSGT
jgi:hypothetical protein